MGSWIRITVLTAVAAVLIGCGPSGTQEDTWAGLTDPDVLARAELEYYWRLPIDLDPDEKVLRCSLVEENLYLLTSNARLVALDAASGEFQWSYVVPEAPSDVFHLVHANGVTFPRRKAGVREMLMDRRPMAKEPYDVVLFNSVKRVYALDRATGRPVRDIKVEFAANTGGACDGGFYYTGSVLGVYYAIRLFEGVSLWWAGTGDMLIAPPEVWGGNLYVAGRDNIFRCVRSGKRPDPTWSQTMEQGVVAPFHVDSRGCFVPCVDNRLYAWDPTTGQKLWDPFIANGELHRGVQVGQATIFQYAQGDALHAIKLLDGSKRWSLPVGRDVLAVIAGKVYLLDAEGALRVVDEITGEQRLAIPLTGWRFHARNVNAPGVWVAGADGHVACIRPTDAEPIFTSDLRADQPPRP